MNQRFLIFFFAIVFSLSGYNNVFACSCAISSPCKMAARSDATFIGKINSVEGKGNSMVHKVEILKHFNGLEDKTEVEIYTDWVTSCAYSMKQDETYVIFAGVNEKTGIVTTGYCSGTKPLSQAKEEVKYLESLEKAEDGKGGLKGSVLEHDLKNKFTVEPWKPREINKVHLESENGEKFEAEIGNDGKYSFSNLFGGWYEVTIFAPERLIASFEERGDEYIRKKGFREIKRKVKIPGSGCEAETFYSFVVNGIISGKVLDVDNVPLAKFPVDIYRFDNEDDMPEQNYKVWTDENGIYMAKGMPSGRYLIGFGIGHDLYINSRFGGYLPTFYPNTIKRKDAVFFNLGDAEFLSDQNLKLPPKLSKRSIKGKVVFKNNDPSLTTKFSAFARRDGVARGDWTDPLQVKSDGSFEFFAYDKTEYTLVFWAEDKKGQRLYSSDCIKIEKSGEVEETNVVIEKGSSNCRVRD